MNLFNCIIRNRIYKKQKQMFNNPNSILQSMDFVENISFIIILRNLHLYLTVIFKY